MSAASEAISVRQADAKWEMSLEGLFLRRWRDFCARRVSQQTFNTKCYPTYFRNSQFEFDPDRKWRLDFYWASARVAVEIDGVSGRDTLGVRTAGRHQRAKGMDDDREKQNAATAAGIKVFRFTASMIKAETSFPQLLAVLNERIGR